MVHRGFAVGQSVIVTLRRARAWTSLVAGMMLGTIPHTTIQAQSSSDARGPIAAGYATMRGVVADSLHNGQLAGAKVVIEGTSRSAMTTPDGRYLVDSIPPGNHRVFLTHPLLDTIGITLTSAPLPFTSGEAAVIDLAVPTSRQITSLICPPAVLRIRGPGAIAGFVRDPETGAPATGSKVQFVYEVYDITGAKKLPMVREATVDSSGAYRICGLPAPLTGKLQVFRNGVSSGEVPAGIESGSLGLRSLSIAAVRTAATAGERGAPGVRLSRGVARVTGVVVDKRGRPIADARVIVLGSGVAAVSQLSGEFALDSLPSGTQSLEVRALGFDATEQAVELASATPAQVRIVMSDYVPVLKTVNVDASADKGLTNVGYLKRKQTGLGYFMDGKDLRTDALRFTDAMRLAPGLKVVATSDGMNHVLRSSREAGGGCVVFVVDGTKWTETTPGDLDSYVRPSELRGVEVYSSATVPAEFQQFGQSTCMAVVIWTSLSTDTKPKK